VVPLHKKNNTLDKGNFRPVMDCFFILFTKFFCFLYISIYYEFSLLHIFSLVIKLWMSAYIRKTDGVYMYHLHTLIHMSYVYP
jgi:hypothetical protein